MIISKDQCPLSGHILYQKISVLYQDSFYKCIILFSHSLNKRVEGNVMACVCLFVHAHNSNTTHPNWARFSHKARTLLALLKAQICLISFQTCTQIFGIHKALIHVKR